MYHNFQCCIQIKELNKKREASVFPSLSQLKNTCYMSDQSFPHSSDGKYRSTTALLSLKFFERLTLFA